MTPSGTRTAARRSTDQDDRRPAPPMRRWFAMAESRKRDPRVVGPISGTPNDVGDVEHTPVLQPGAALNLADDPWHPLHSGFHEIARLHPDERSALARVDIRR